MLVWRGLERSCPRQGARLMILGASSSLSRPWLTALAKCSRGHTVLLLALVTELFSKSALCTAFGACDFFLMTRPCSPSCCHFPESSRQCSQFCREMGLQSRQLPRSQLPPSLASSAHPPLLLKKHLLPVSRSQREGRARRRL